MRSKTNPVFSIFSGMVLILALFLGACDSDDVTGPVQARNAPPVTTATNNAAWSITVTTNPDSHEFLAGGFSQVLVSARRSDNNQIVPSGTTALLSTTAGSLTTAEGQTGDSVPIVFDAAGQARATINTGTFNVETTIIIRAQIESSYGSTRIQMIETQPEAPFQMTSVSPNSGHPSGGTGLTIIGSGFEAPIRVSLSGSFGTLVAENPRVSSSTRITATTPAINLASGQNAAATVIVENAFDATGNPTAVDSLANAFTYTRSSTGPTTLKIISFSPTQGPNEGGTQVTIRGEGFGNEAQVFFSTAGGPQIESTVLSITPTQIEAITPAATGPNAPNANSRVPIRIIDPVSGQTASSVGTFQYGGAGGQMFISSIRPTEGEFHGGDEVTVFGQGFEEPVAVEAGLLAQQVLSVSGTEILFRSVPAQIGCANQSGSVSVTNIETNENAGGPTFTYRPVQPQILGISPTSGFEGDTVTIIGVGRAYTVGFDPPIRVLIDGVLAGGATISGTFGETVMVQAPPYTGTYPTEDCGNGTTGNRTDFVNVEVINLSTGCSDTLNNGWGYDPPADTTCAGGGIGNNPSTVTINPPGLIGGFNYSFSLLVSGPALNTGSLEWWFGSDPNSDPADATGTATPTHDFVVGGNYTITVKFTNVQNFDGTSTRDLNI